MSTVSGQIDIKPTILHMLGIKTDNDIYFGNDLFHDGRKGYIALRNGDFISEEYIYTEGTCYDRETGKMLAHDNNHTVYNENIKNLCFLTTKSVEHDLSYSDRIIYGDLFRFVDFKKDEAKINAR